MTIVNKSMEPPLSREIGTGLHVICYGIGETVAAGSTIRKMTDVDVSAYRKLVFMIRTTDAAHSFDLLFLRKDPVVRGAIATNTTGVAVSNGTSATTGLVDNTQTHLDILIRNADAAPHSYDFFIMGAN